jgi:multidrug efflux system membrane fusion protein
MIRQGGEYHARPSRRIFWLFVLCAAIAGGAWLIFGGHSGPAQNDKGGKGRRGGQIPIVTVQPTARKDVPVYLDGLGTVQAYNTVTVHTQVDGQLVDVHFTEGQDVKRGDLLAKIDPRTYQAQYDQAAATKAKDAALLENAKRDLKRYENLGDTISGQVLDTQRATVRQLEAAVKSDQAAVENARTLLSYTSITAPISGRTGMRQVDQGNIVHPGDANGIVVLTQLQPISVVFSLPQQNLQSILAQGREQGKLRTLAVDSAGKTLDQGTLELVDNQIDQTTGTVKLKATFANANEQLWPGGFVNVRLLLTTRANVLVVPTVAVQRGPQGTYVFVLKDDEKSVELRPVKVVMTEGLLSVIDEGLKDGERVVTDGAAKLEDNAKVALPAIKEGKDAKAAPDGKPADAKDGAGKDGDASKGKGGKRHKHAGE